MIAKYKPLLLYVILPLAVIAGFIAWLKLIHDPAILAAERTRVRIEQLATDNQRLTSEVATLKAENARIQQETEERVSQIEQERQRATTPQDEVLYIASNSPLHPKLDETAPQIVFPIGDGKILADILADKRTSEVKLAGCEQINANLNGEVQKLEAVIVNKDEQIKLEKSKKNASTLQKFKAFGVGVGLGAAAVTLAFLL